ncbi:MAG: isoprenyl transferase [Firmicutes bacterium]|nr:isoprenyl transferase [Erysipelotrichaceae bacterium]MDD6524830.1 isoprenyl transferase [Bacillota bacterium]MDY4972389.1 isoprenyl transferase [Erysipelotrichaceae bacterium]
MEQLQHVAIIMDGNGRWAKAHGKVRTQGHLVGVDNVRNIAIKANDMNIKVLTVYAFSTENWKRPLEEVDYLMKLPALFFNKFMKELMEKNIKITMIGEMEGIPQETAKVLQRAIDETANNTGMILNFAMNYGSRREITLAAKKYALDVLNDKAGLDIDEKEFGKYFMTADFPEVDLLIRTSGELRLSNFLLWQIAYTEFMFVDEPWPEFTPERFEYYCNEFLKRDRRFGGIKQ